MEEQKQVTKEEKIRQEEEHDRREEVEKWGKKLRRISWRKEKRDGFLTS